MKKEEEPKIVLEREYIVPLRKGWEKVPRYKRGKKAIKTLKEFMVRHMKIYDRDLKKIKIDVLLNNEIMFRGIRKPPSKIKVKAKKFEDNTVKVELVELPGHVKYAKLREERKKEKIKESLKKKEEEGEKVEKERKEEEEKGKVEKEKLSKEEILEKTKKEAREKKHVVTKKEVPLHRKTLTRH